MFSLVSLMPGFNNYFYSFFSRVALKVLNFLKSITLALSYRFSRSSTLIVILFGITTIADFISPLAQKLLISIFFKFTN